MKSNGDYMDWRAPFYSGDMPRARARLRVYTSKKKKEKMGKIPVQFEQISNPIAIPGDDLISP